MRRVWNEDPFSWVTARLVVCTNHENARQFPMGSGGGLQCDGIHAADFGKAGLKGLLNIKRSLNPPGGHIGMSLRETFQTCHALIDFRVVLHRAGAERIEPEIDVIIPGRQTREMANDVDLTELGHIRNAVAQQFRLDQLLRVAGRYVEFRQVESPAARRTLLEDDALV